MIDEHFLAQCRALNLYQFLTCYDSQAWQHEGALYLRSKAHDSCVVRKDGHWYWNSQGISGTNPIDFICSYYNVTFKAAVSLLTGSDTTIYKSLQPISKDYIKPIKVPPRLKQPWPELFLYLCEKRRLEKSFLQRLIDNNKLYLTNLYGFHNICFYNLANNHYEIVGISERRFKRCSDAEHYWSFGNKYAKRCYICESAIDAISLYELIKDNAACYISIAGSTTRKNLLDKINKEFQEPILAVDNDPAGNKTCALFPHWQRIIPKQKDWNDDLRILKEL